MKISALTDIAPCKGAEGARLVCPELLRLPPQIVAESSHQSSQLGLAWSQGATITGGKTPLIVAPCPPKPRIIAQIVAANRSGIVAGIVAGGPWQP